MKICFTCNQMVAFLASDSVVNRPQTRGLERQKVGCRIHHLLRCLWKGLILHHDARQNSKLEEKLQMSFVLLHLEIGVNDL